MTQEQFDRLEELEKMDEEEMTASDFEEMERLADIAMEAME
jgi:hypothetical protein